MDNETLKLFCQVFFSLARSEKKSEIIKEMLCQFDAFEPYTVFKHLTVSSPSSLNPQDLSLFLQRNKLIHDESAVSQNFIRQFDRDRDGELSYSEYLRPRLFAGIIKRSFVGSCRPCFPPISQFCGQSWRRGSLITAKSLRRRSNTLSPVLLTRLLYIHSLNDKNTVER